MSGQRPSVLEGTRHCTSFTSVPPVTRGRGLSPPAMPVREAGEPPTPTGMNRWGRSARMRRVIMGAVTSPARRPDDASGDADVMRRLRAGDRSAVAALYTRFRRPAFALARRILADDALAEDVLQEVFLSVWRDPSAFDRARGSVASWLLAVVRSEEGRVGKEGRSRGSPYH